MATYYLLTLYMQQVLQFSPVMAGLASLPVSVGIILSAGISSKLVERFVPRAVAAPGLLVAAIGMYWLSTLNCRLLVCLAHPARAFRDLLRLGHGVHADDAYGGPRRS